MTTRPIGRRRGSVIGFRVNPSNAAQYGADLVRRKELQEEMDKRQARTALQRMMQEEMDLQQARTATERDKPDTDPRMGHYGHRVRDSRLSVPEIETPEYDYSGRLTDSALYQLPEDFDIRNPLIKTRPPGGEYQSHRDPSHVRGQSGYGQIKDTSFSPERARAEEINAQQRRAQAAEAVDAYLAELEYERRQLEAKRDEALAEARDDIAFQYDQQIQDINNDIGTLRGNLGDLRGRVPSYLQQTQARFDQAVQAARGIVDAAGPELEDIKNQALKGIEAGYDSAAEGLSDTLEVIGADEATGTALEGVVRELEGLAYETVEGQHDDVTALNEAAEQVAVAGARAAGITDEVEAKRWATQTEKDLKKSIGDLVDRRTRLEEAKARAWKKARERINEQFDEAAADIDYQDQFSFAMSTLETSMESMFAEDFDIFERDALMNTFEDFIGAGITTLADFSEQMAVVQEQKNEILRAIANADDPKAKAQLQEALEELPTFEAEEREALETMFGIFDESMQEWSNNQPNPADFGWSGSGSGASNTSASNIADAKAGRGAYGARVKHTAEVGSFIKNKWGVEVQGMNYFRPAGQSGGGQAKNSDHKTAGALDIMLNANNSAHMQKGAQIMNYLSSLPSVAYTIWEPTDPNDAHYDHIHVSFKLADGGYPDPHAGHDHGPSGGGSSGGGGTGANSGTNFAV